MRPRRFSAFGARYVSPSHPTHPTFLAAPGGGWGTVAPDVLVWDDLVVTRALLLRRFRWPTRDPLLLRSLDQRGRFAIREDRLEGRDPQAALLALAVDRRARVARYGAAVRLVGSPSNRLYDSLPGRKGKDPPAASSVSIVVNYRDRPELMERFLASLARQRIDARVELLLVDNQSTPESRARVRSLAESLPRSFPVKHLAYDAPFNHSAQCNLAARESTGEVLVMANNDIELLRERTLERLAAHALLPGIATVGPRFVDGERLVSAGIHAYPDPGLPGGAGIRESEVPPLSKVTRHTVGNSFACAAIARATWDRLGGLDETRFPIEYNDADFLLRARRLGLSHLYLGEEAVHHRPGASRATPPDRVRKLHEEICRLWAEEIRELIDESEAELPAVDLPGALSLGAGAWDAALRATRLARRALSRLGLLEAPA